MEKILERIKELLNNENNMASGLFSGDMGICFSLYMINRNIKDKETEKITDKLIDKIIDRIATMKDVSFDKGLTGIGWAINLLHMKKCIEGDIDDILYNIDAMVYKNVCEQNRHHSVDLLSGLIGYLFYIVFRFKNESHKKETFQNTINETTLRIIIDKLEYRMPEKFYMSSRDILTTVLWDTPILFYCLGEALKIGVYKEKIERMVEDWSYVLIGTLPFFNINRLALANSLAFLNEELDNNIDTYVDTLFYSINFQNYLHEIDKDSTSMNGDWFYAMFNMYEARKLMKKDHVRYMEIEEYATKLYLLYDEIVLESLMSFKEKQYNSSLINGLSGSLLVYSIYKEVFNVHKQS